jgi:hypothetical protein
MRAKRSHKRPTQSRTIVVSVEAPEDLGERHAHAVAEHRSRATRRLLSGSTLPRLGCSKQWQFDDTWIIGLSFTRRQTERDLLPRDVREGNFAI